MKFVETRSVANVMQMFNLNRMQLQLLLISAALLLSFMLSPFVHADEIITPDPKHRTRQLSVRLTPNEKLWLANHQTVRVGVKNGWMPIEFLLESNQHRGLSIDYLIKISNLLQIKFIVVDYTKETNPDTLDMISGISNTIVHAPEFQLLNQPFLTLPYAIYTNKLLKKHHHVRSLDDLKQSRVAIFKTGQLAHKVRDNYPKMQLVYVEIADEAFDLLKNGTIDAYVGNEMVLDYHIAVHRLNYIEKAGLTPFSSSVSMAVKKDQPELASILEKSLVAIGANNQELLDNWRMIDNKGSQVLFVIITLAIIALLVVGYRFYQLKRNARKQNLESQQHIWYQANFDHLTALPNRHLLQNRLEQAIERADRSKLPIALLFLDLDNFKQVNDTSGHSVGDALLKEAATRINDCVRAEDTTGRFGGDEFMIVMSDVHDVYHVDKVCQKILVALKKPFNIKEDIFFISGSIGVSIYPNDGNNPEELISHADQAMYESKKLGRNRYQFFTEAIQIESLKKLSLSNDLREALKLQQFVLHYQPIINLKNSEILKAEALIRWQHPTRGLIGPVDFIPIAEETGLIIELGEWVLHQALADLPRLNEVIGGEFQISINVSPHQFHQPNNLLKWIKDIQQQQIPGHCLCLEITEGLLLEPSVDVIQTINALRHVGIEFSIDDFGTGYSALGYIRKFDIDYVKIDKSFIQNLATHHDDATLCEAIIHMANKLKIKVIAEGVETEIQKSLLQDFACDYGQGYLFSKPIPLAQLLIHLQSSNQES